MIKLIGNNIDALPFKGLRKIKDIIYFDGPLLSQFITTEGKSILFYWLDFDSDYNRWLVFPVSNSELSLYMGKQISLRDIVLSRHNSVFYTVDINTDLVYSNITQIKQKDIPKEYLPGEKSFYW